MPTDKFRWFFDTIDAPSQFPCLHQPPHESSMEALQAREDLMKSIESFLKKFNRISFQKTPKVLMQAWDNFFKIKHAQSEEAQELLSKLLQDLQSINEELAEFINHPISPISPVTDSLIMGDEHLDTIPETESDELIKSSVENLVQIQDESVILSEILPRSESHFRRGFQMENFKIFSNPLFDLDEEITSTKVDQIDDEVLGNTNSIPPGIEYLCFNAESDLLESLLHRDTSINDSQKIDSLLDEFADELTLLKSIPPGIDDDNLVLEGEIHLVERLVYDSSSPHPPEELNVENSIEFFSPSPIPAKDSDSLIEEIDVFLDSDGSIPPGIESDDYDSEGDDNSTSLPELKSFHVDYPDSGDSTIDVVEDIPVDVPNILPTHPILLMDFDFIPSHNDLESDLDVSSPSGDRNKIYDKGICIEVQSTKYLATLSPVIDTLLPFSSKNKDKVFNHGVLASKEKSLPSSSHRGFKTSKPFHHKSPDFPDCDDSRARGFVLHSLEFHILSFILGIPIS
ncbi:hypothetical protein Tco_0571030 [Tanacetum coccineum]